MRYHTKDRTFTHTTAFCQPSVAQWNPCSSTRQQTTQSCIPRLLIISLIICCAVFHMVSTLASQQPLPQYNLLQPPVRTRRTRQCLPSNHFKPSQLTCNSFFPRSYSPSNPSSWTIPTILSSGSDSKNTLNPSYISPASQLTISPATYFT